MKLVLVKVSVTSTYVLVICRAPNKGRFPPGQGFGRCLPEQGGGISDGVATPNAAECWRCSSPLKIFSPRSACVQVQWFAFKTHLHRVCLCRCGSVFMPFYILSYAGVFFPPLFFPRKALNGSVFRTGCTLPEDFLTANNDLNRAPDTYQDSSISNAL